jgi:sphinganine C4-monooxygenase
MFHVNKWLYRTFHSWHHRLYVPYAFGALYNHPVEGVLLDSLGTLIGRFLAGMSTRQDLLLFTFATLKTVDDHCGYSLPFDPLQLLFSNNADYHDIHHQTIGIKKNFAQPFFIHWDSIVGTRMTRKDVAEAHAKRDKSIPSANGAARANGNVNGHANESASNGYSNGYSKPSNEKEKVQ